MSSLAALSYRARLGLQLGLLLLSLLLLGLILTWGPAVLRQGMEQGGGLALYFGVTFGVWGLEADVDLKWPAWSLRCVALLLGISWDVQHQGLRTHDWSHFIGWSLPMCIPLLVLGFMRLGLRGFATPSQPSAV